MPLYEYYCSACKWRFEMLRSMQESAADASCPECGTKLRGGPFPWLPHFHAAIAAATPAWAVVVPAEAPAPAANHILTQT